MPATPCSANTSRESSIRKRNLAVECLADAQESREEVKFTFCCIIANRSSNNAEDDRSPWSDKTGCGSCSNKTRNASGTPADHRPFPSKTPIQKCPGDRAEHGSQVRVPASHNSTEVGTEG